VTALPPSSVLHVRASPAALEIASVIVTMTGIVFGRNPMFDAGTLVPPGELTPWPVATRYIASIADSGQLAPQPFG
jgi:hypothetical protein